MISAPASSKPFPRGHLHDFHVEPIPDSEDFVVVPHFVDDVLEGASIDGMMFGEQRA
jgi:hypothetical protein